MPQWHRPDMTKRSLVRGYFLIDSNRFKVTALRWYTCQKYLCVGAVAHLAFGGYTSIPASIESLEGARGTKLAKMSRRSFRARPKRGNTRYQVVGI